MYQLVNNNIVNLALFVLMALRVVLPPFGRKPIKPGRNILLQKRAGNRVLGGAGLSAVVAMGLLAGMPAAQALVLDASGQITVGGQVKEDTDTSTTSVNAFMNATGMGPEGYGYGWGYGDDTGTMYSAAGGGNIFDARGAIRQTVDFTNTTGTAQNYYFDFTINSGSIRAFNTIILSNGGQYIEAGRRAAILLNGTEIFVSEAALTNRSSGISLSRTGTTLGTYTQGTDGYSWDTYVDRLDLGVFSAGESFRLSYEISTYARGNIAAVPCGSSPIIDEETGNEIGGGPLVVSFDGGETYCRRNYAEARFGDPNNLSSSPISNMTVTTGMTMTQVPEPGTLFLLGGGMLAFAVGRRGVRKG